MPSARLARTTTRARGGVLALAACALLAAACSRKAAEPATDAAASSGGQSAMLVVEDARDFASGGPKGGPFEPAETSYVLRNDGNESSYWTPSTDLPWLRVTPTAGQLAPGESVVLGVRIDAERALALAPGRHAGELRVVDRSRGRAAATIRVELWIGVQVESSGALRIHGEKHLPIFAWREVPTPTWVDYWSGLGVDTYLGHGGEGGIEETRALLDALYERGMWGVLEFEPGLGGHPALLAWTLGEGDRLAARPVEELREERAAVRAADVSRPIFGGLAGDGASEHARAVAELCDVRGLGFDDASWAAAGASSSPPVPPRSHNAAPRAAWSLVALDERAAIAAGVGLDAWTRYGAWSAIVRGSTGIGYATHPADPSGLPNLSSAVETELTRTHAAMRELEDVILGEPLRSVLVLKGRGSEEISWMLRQGPDSAWLFVANDGRAPQGAEVRFTFDRPVASVENWMDDRVLPTNDRSFFDTIEPLGVRVYELRF